MASQRTGDKSQSGKNTHHFLALWTALQTPVPAQSRAGAHHGAAVAEAGTVTDAVRAQLHLLTQPSSGTRSPRRQMPQEGSGACALAMLTAWHRSMNLQLPAEAPRFAQTRGDTFPAAGFAVGQ